MTSDNFVFNSKIKQVNDLILTFALIDKQIFNHELIFSVPTYSQAIVVWTWLW